MLSCCSLSWSVFLSPSFISLFVSLFALSSSMFGTFPTSYDEGLCLRFNIWQIPMMGFQEEDAIENTGHEPVHRSTTGTIILVSGGL